MSEPETLTVDVNGFATRVWRKGSGPKLGFLAGFGGLPRWVPFLDELAKSRTVIVPSLPGFPGGDRGHSVLDTHLDWLLAVRDLLAKAELDGADLAGSSVGASLVAEMAALWPASVRRLALIAPFGLFDETDPPTDPWAQRGRCGARPDVRRSGDLEGAEGGARRRQLDRMADRADARQRGRGAHLLAARQHQAGEATEADPGADAADLGRAGCRSCRAAMPSVSPRASPGKSETKVIAGAGHLAELDKPGEVAAAIVGWTN